MISIIVPCYNGEKNITRLLDSLVMQTDKRFQLIIVDDGSTDNSVDIIKSYSLKLPFELISTSNFGVSHARNAGLKIVKGEYVCFFDSDDKIDINTVERLNEFTGADAYFFDYYKNDEKCNKMKSIKDGTLKEEIYLSLLNNESIKGYVWNKIFRTSVITENNLCFDENIGFCEDLLFVAQFVNAANKIEYINQAFYHYYTNDSSVTKLQYSKSKVTSIDAMEKVISYMDKNVCADAYCAYVEYYYNVLISLLMNGYSSLTAADNAEYKKIKNSLKKYPLKYVKSSRIRFSVILAKISPVLLHTMWLIVRRKK